jgi:hypothetical protein
MKVHVRVRFGFPVVTYHVCYPPCVFLIHDNASQSRLLFTLFEPTLPTRSDPRPDHRHVDPTRQPKRSFQKDLKPFG